MSVDSDAAILSEHNGRITNQNVDACMSPELREHITQAAQEIRAEHHAELTDVHTADGAVRLFSSIIHSNGFEKSADVASGGDVESLAADLSGLLGDAVRTGTGVVAVSLTAVAQELMSTVLRLSARPSDSVSSAEAPVTEEPLKPQHSLSPDEVRLRNVFKRFLPMLILSVRQGGTGHGLAEKVVTMFGRPIYEQASGVGKDRLMAILRTEPDLWAQVAPIEAEFSRFLDEFLGYDRCVQNRE